jgi:hypothetical protein
MKCDDPIDIKAPEKCHPIALLHAELCQSTGTRRDLLHELQVTQLHVTTDQREMIWPGSNTAPEWMRNLH